jgi:hypothetical protein
MRLDNLSRRNSVAPRMKRRWKVGVALAVVGIAALLACALLSPAKPPLGIGFYGYVTNDASRPIAELPPPDGTIFAVFVVTNQTRHTLRAEARLSTRNQKTSEAPLTEWLQRGPDHGFFAEDYATLKPGKTALTGIVVPRAGEPVRAVVNAHMSYVITPWTRIRDHLPWSRPTYSAAATNQLRD